MESIFRRSLRKTGFVQNPKRRKSFLKYCVLNGKFRKKQNYVLSRSQKTVQKPADFCIFHHSADGKNFSFPIHQIVPFIEQISHRSLFTAYFVPLRRRSRRGRAER
jgi:hypothetical protein